MGKHLYRSLFLISLDMMFFENETPTHVLSCGFCETFKGSILQNIFERLFLYLWNVFATSKNTIVIRPFN